MKKREFLKVLNTTFWTTPVVSSIILPAHASTSSGIMINVEMFVPSFNVIISDNSPNFFYTYQVAGTAAISGNSGSESSIVIGDELTGQYAGSIQEITVTVTDNSGNTCTETFIFDIEG